MSSKLLIERIVTPPKRDSVNYYLDIAEVTASNSTCLRYHWGAVIVSDDEVISTGCTGAPRGRQSCRDLCQCHKDLVTAKSNGTIHGHCRSVHAEANAIMSVSARMMKGATMYLVGFDALKDDSKGQK